MRKRLEVDNRVIYERINNIEYIKCVSGEDFEEKRIDQQLEETFQKNNRSLFKLTLLKAIPNYLLIPNNPILFIFLVLFNTGDTEKNQPIFIFANFIRYYSIIQRLNGDISRIIDSLLSLEELSSSLLTIKESIDVLNQENSEPQQLPVTKNFQ